LPEITRQIEDGIANKVTAEARDGGTVEYRVDHPSWRVWRATTASLEGNLANVFGDPFAGVLAGPPDSAFVADGSAVTVSLRREFRRHGVNRPRSSTSTAH
jgi:hypothetical protein